ncbi:MAG: dehydrogenase [Candidatus Rokubacteria bacterium 13_1_20CM_2_69_58]|nr:MAG: dehydrogenase [Candidatus Rokubacteria bacterium 13_1_40CM_3_69_38]OLE49779.1 MAG: dehydrogenase [Candidatus Rokubacteria bacterium 13_1_20CM_2_69_58]
MTLIGASVRRVEDARLLQGQGRFVADLTLSRMLHVAFLRSPHAHARLVSVDTRPARTLPGVAACVTGDEIATHARPIRAESKMAGYHATEFPPLARGKVRFVGEAVVAVLAESRYVAEDALEAVDVRYAALPVVATPETAMAGDAPLVHEAAGSNVLLSRAFVRGDADAAMAGAAVVVGDRFRFHRHAGVTMENRACLADWNTGAGELTLWSSTQVPGLLREALAELLDLPAHRLRVVAPDVGGGFGVKSALYPEEVAVCALARLTGRPVKWVGDRREDLLTSTQAWDETIDAELAVDADGTIHALRARVVADVGAYSIHPWTASIEVVQVISFLPGPYRVPHYRGEAWGVATNKAPMGPYRGVGRPVSTFVTEALVDRAARRLGMDPVALRLRNLIRPDELPYRSPSGVVWDSGSFVESLERARDVVAYEHVRAAQRDPRRAGRYVGVGVACYVELTGVGSAIPASPGAAINTGTEGATVRVDPSGTVTASFGLACQGQGHETTLAQVVAAELGARLEDVRVVSGDTAAGPAGTGTYASRSAVIGGGAAILAARALREKALAIGAHLLEVSADDLTLADSRATVRGAPDRALSLREIARAAYAGAKRLPAGMEPGLEATRFYDPYFGTASNATHIAVVEVDPETCGVVVRRFVVVEDCGRIINPLIVEGQAIGGVAQGVGAALLEEIVYDGDGQLLTGSLMDYLVPTAAELPPVEVVHLERPSPTTLGGFKGVGEGGTIGAPAAVANAIADALKPFGIELSELPVTPDRLFRLLSRPRQAL